MIYISYFYQIRNFNNKILPLSTAVFDPDWYHNNTKNKKMIFLDKNKVINGLRIEELNPSKVDCKCKECISKDPRNCSFISNYKEYLNSLDFNAIYNKILDTQKYFKAKDACLIVYEAPTNKCSEREPLKEWFKENGIELKEWNKNENT